MHINAGTAWLIDIGSTFTKACAVDLADGRLLAAESSPTTVTADVTLGLQAAVDKVEARTGQKMADAAVKLACSSAAGGLGMVVVGLVPTLTVEAARRAALGGGAKVLSVYGYELTQADVAAIGAQKPDLLLLSGGIDGGNRAVLLANARALAASSLRVPVIVAGNKSASPEAAAILRAGGLREVRLTENILPELDRLNIEPVREIIRQLFVEHIVRAKGIERARSLVDGVVMPTPMAAMEAVRLLADGSPEEPGWGEVLAFEIGGATTNVHSVAEWRPVRAGVLLKGLPEARVKRTVEGDLGMRWNAITILEVVGAQRLAHHCDVDLPDLDDRVKALRADVEQVPTDATGKALDVALARTALELAVERHAGRLETYYTPTGPTTVQYGKDLTRVSRVVGTGGIIVHAADPSSIFPVLFQQDIAPQLLKPRAPSCYVDTHYVLYAAGLLASIAPTAALRLLKRSLVEVAVAVQNRRSRDVSTL